MFRHVSAALLRAPSASSSSTTATTLHARRTLTSTSSGPAATAGDFDMGASYTHTEAEGYVRHSGYGAIEVPQLRIDQFVWQDMHRWQNKIALVSKNHGRTHTHSRSHYPFAFAQVCGETDRQISYAQLRDHCAALAVRLQRPEFGLRPLDMVALCLPNSPDFPIAAFGSIEAGMTLTSINPIYTAGTKTKHQLITNTHTETHIHTV